VFKLFEIAMLRKEAQYLGTAWVERNSSDESHEHLRSNVKKTIKILEVYDHGDEKWMFTIMSAEKEV